MTQQGRSGGFFDADGVEEIQLRRGGFADAGEALFAELHTMLLQSAQ